MKTKLRFCCTFSLLAMGIPTWSQLPLTFFYFRPHYPHVGDTATFDLTARYFTQIASLQFSLGWDTTRLVFVGAEKAALDPVVGDQSAAQGQLGLSWFDVLGQGLSLPDSTTLLHLQFYVLDCLPDIFLTNTPVSVEAIAQYSDSTRAVTIDFDPLPTIAPLGFAGLGADTMIDLGEHITLQAICPNCDFIWSTGDHTSTITVNAGTFSVTVSTPAGCRAVDTILVKDTTDSTGFIRPSNLLTPNDDGFNDVLVFEHLDKFPRNRLVVFNCWGDTVFERNNYDNNWDGSCNGKPLPAGVYFYVLEVPLAQLLLKSSLLLLRE